MWIVAQGQAHKMGASQGPALSMVRLAALYCEETTVMKYGQEVGKE